jgi:hypothetical protein
MKNSNDTIGNRTRDLPACSSVPQPTAPRRAPYILQSDSFTLCKLYIKIANSVLCSNILYWLPDYNPFRTEICRVTLNMTL